MLNKNKTIVLINGKSGSGKDYLTNRVINQLKTENINALSYAHADLLKKKLSEMYNIDLKWFYDTNKDNLYVHFNNNHLFESNKVYTFDQVNMLISLNEEGQIYDVNSLRELLTLSLDKEYNDEDANKIYYNEVGYEAEPIYVSLRTLLVYFGTYVYKAMLLPVTLQFESFNQFTKTKEFEEADILFVTDNRYDSEFKFIYNFAVFNNYNLKYIQVISDTYNKIDNIAEKSFNIDVEDYIDLKDIMIADNSKRTEEATNNLVSEIVEFIKS